MLDLEGRSHVMSVMSLEARVAVQGREVTGKLERELGEELRAQWMASVRGPGWARRVRCHMVI